MVRTPRLVLVATLLLVTASSAAAQSSAQPVAPSTGHSVWRDTLIGLGVGTAAGLGVGKMRDNFHNAECAVLDCNRAFEMDTLGPIGAAGGAAVGFLVHRIWHGDKSRSMRSALATSTSPTRPAARSPSLIVAPSYSAGRKAVLIRAEF